MEKELSRKGKIELFASIVSLTISLFVCFHNFSQDFSSLTFIMILTFICLSCTLYYGLYGYKIPHGNLLKWTYVIYGVVLLSKCIFSAYYQAIFSSVLAGLSSLGVIFISSRLNKIKKNRWIALIVLVLLIIWAIIGSIQIGFSIEILIDTVIWISLVGFYFVRYKIHREAGLLDKDDII